MEYLHPRNRPRGKSIATSNPSNQSSPTTYFQAESLYPHRQRRPTTTSQRPVSSPPFSPPEQDERSKRTRERIFQAVSPVLHITHELVEVATGSLAFAGVPGLESAAKLLLQIWDSVQLVESNRLACLRLTERCADILIAIHSQVSRAGDDVRDELRIPMLLLEDNFMTISGFMEQYAQQPFYKRYVHKDEMLVEIANCNIALQDCLYQFQTSISMAIMEHVLTLAKTSTPTLSGSPNPGSYVPAFTAESTNSEPLDDLGLPIRAISDSTTVIKVNLRKVQEKQNFADRTQDMDDHLKTLRRAVDAKNDAEMISILQVAKNDLPEALKLLLQNYEKRNSLLTTPHLMSGSPKWITSLPSRSSSWPLDEAGSAKFSQLDRDFMKKEISALKRAIDDLIAETFSECLTKKDVELGQVIGRGYFSSVYKARWSRREVAVKVLMSTSSINAFVNERNIWKSIKHPNILPLLAASDISEVRTGSRFFLSPFMKNGSLTDYLKRLEWEGVPVIDALPVKILHDIAKGMEYLHNERIIHGDLRASNILVDDDYVCRVADFGQSKFVSMISYKDPASHHAIRWQPPEILSGHSTLLTQSIDSYSYAITCSEILNMGDIPWPGFHDTILKSKVLDLGERPTIPWHVADSLQISDIIKTCWHNSPGERLSFTAIVRTFDEMQPHSPCGSSPLIVVSPDEIYKSYLERPLHLSPLSNTILLSETFEDAVDQGHQTSHNLEERSEF